MPLKKISINKDISIAQTMPSNYYLCDDYFNLTLENVFSRSWQLLIDKKSLLFKINPITFLKDTYNEPLLIIKNLDKITSISNVCTHRGNLLCSIGSNNSNIQCKYHGRTFNLDGKINKYPGFSGVKNFPDKTDNLTKIEPLIWKNFIFLSLTTPQYNFKDIFNDIESRLGWYPFDELEYNEDSSDSWIINANWALYCENYLEGFHVPFIHKGLNSDIELGTYQTVLLENGVLQYTHSKKIKDRLKIPEEYKNYKSDIYAYYYWLFPNIMLNFYSWGLSINIIEPIDKERTRIKFLSYPIKDNKQPSNSASSVAKVECEDQEIVLNVQKGLKSKFYNRGRYSVEHEKGVHHFHQLLCKFIN